MTIPVMAILKEEICRQHWKLRRGAWKLDIRLWKQFKTTFPFLYWCFKIGWESIECYPHSGRSPTSRTTKSVVHVWTIIKGNSPGIRKSEDCINCQKAIQSIWIFQLAGLSVNSTPAPHMPDLVNLISCKNKSISQNPDLVLSEF